MRARCAVDCVLIIVNWNIVAAVLFGSNPMTGSVGVVTINLPRLALKSKNEKEFFKGLAELMDMAKDSLETKRKVLERLTDANLYPYTKFLFCENIKQRFQSILEEPFFNHWFDRHERGGA